MTRSPSAPHHQDEQPLISRRVLVWLAVVVATLIGATVAIMLSGQWLGDRMHGAGHSSDTTALSVTIGHDTLFIPANMVRFAEQRVSGPTDRIDLYLTWPGLQGYSPALSDRFRERDQPGRLIFLQIAQSTMSKDMSGRVAPIYNRLFTGPAQPHPSGLTLHRLSADSGYGDEVILTGERPGRDPYAVRCLLPRTAKTSTAGDCQRDIHIGGDLSVLYRFSSTLLDDWDHIDAAVRSFVEDRLRAAAGATP